MERAVDMTRVPTEGRGEEYHYAYRAFPNWSFFTKYYVTLLCFYFSVCMFLQDYTCPLDLSAKELF
jgi:hypothetical protein